MYHTCPWEVPLRSMPIRPHRNTQGFSCDSRHQHVPYVPPRLSTTSKTPITYTFRFRPVLLLVGAFVDPPLSGTAMWDGTKSILFMWFPISLTCVLPPFCTRFVSLSIPIPVSVSDSHPHVVGKSISVSVRSLQLITDGTDQLNGAEHES